MDVSTLEWRLLGLFILIMDKLGLVDFGGRLRGGVDVVDVVLILSDDLFWLCFFVDDFIHDNDDVDAGADFNFFS